MFGRIFLSALVAGLFVCFSAGGLVSTSAARAEVYDSNIAKKKYIKRRQRSKNRSLRSKPKKNILYQSKRAKKVRYKARTKKSVRRKNKSKKIVRYKSKGEKVTKASLNVVGIKNLRHAKLTNRGRMSVAKDTRKLTRKNWGKRASYKYRPGTIVVSNYTRRLYYIVRPGKVISYPIATPRPDEVWSGRTKVSKKKLNPDWYPTPSMREKNPNLPEKVVGGSKHNPFGKRALYLGKSLYRIHGTNKPGSIGKSASGGCYRMHNNHIRALFKRVKIGTPVVVTTRKKI